MSNYDTYDKQIAEGTSDVALHEKALAGHAPGAFANFYRYLVIDVVYDPQIVDDNKVAYWEHTLGVQNIKFAKVLPRNTIIGQRVAEGSSADSETPMFLFPMLPPNISLPCNPGEHVWVMFENKTIKKSDLGFWLGRIVGPGFVEDVNHTHMPRIYDPSFSPSTKDIHDGNDDPVYEFRPGRVSSKNGVRSTDYETTTIRNNDDELAYEALLRDTDAGMLEQYEAVPRFRKRPGDIAIEGTNNSLIVLGRHRTGPVADYGNSTDEKGLTPLPHEGDLTGPGAAMIDLVAGRGQTDLTSGKPVTNSMGNQEIGKSAKELIAGEGDIDLASDRSRVLIAQRSRVDADFALNKHNIPLSVVDSENGSGAVAVKSDKVRIIARSDVTIIVSGFRTDNNGNMVTDEDESNWATIVVRKDGNIISKPAKNAVMTVDDEATADFVALQKLVKHELQDIRDEFNKFVSEKYNIHVHPHQLGPTQATPQLGKPIPPAGDVASKKLRTT